jgi:glucose/arabinose dehydrogenase
VRRTTVTVLAAPLLAAVLLAGCSQASGPVVLDPEPDLATPAATPTAATSPTPRTSPPVRPGEPAVPTIAETVATGLRSPWGLAFLPDGSALVSERDTSRVLRVGASGGVGEVGVVPDVAFGGEGGLLGLAVSPTFSRDRWVYAYHTAPGENRLVRMRLQGERLGPPQLLLGGIPAAEIHNGGRIAFGPDGLLYVGTGDAADTALSPRPDTLAGKVLRLTPTGDVPADNPDPGSPVWSSGHRNVQGLAWGPDGTMYASEFGANTWDELNVIRPGRDYGWPSVEGAGGRPQGFVDPVVVWPTDQASPSGIAVANGTVFVAALRGQRLWAVPVAGPRAGEPQASFTGELGRLRTVAVAPDGSLWLVTSNTDGRAVPGEQDDRILRLELG